jgi:hypothetical protein
MPRRGSLKLVKKGSNSSENYENSPAQMESEEESSKAMNPPQSPIYDDESHDEKAQVSGSTSTKSPAFKVKVDVLIGSKKTNLSKQSSNATSDVKLKKKRSKKDDDDQENASLLHPKKSKQKSHSKDREPLAELLKANNKNDHLI